MKLLFFGVLTDAAGEKEIEIKKMPDLNAVKKYVEENYPKVLNYSHIISVNRAIISDNIELKENDEIAFLPPFTGG